MKIEMTIEEAQIMAAHYESFNLEWSEEKGVDEECDEEIEAAEKREIFWQDIVKNARK